MTSASELFHIRRHRLGRNDLDSGFHSSPPPDLHHHHHRFHDSDDDDSPRLRRHYNVRRLRHPERASDRFDGRLHRRSLLNESVDSAENVRGTLRATDGERLPAGVLLARARLVQRLRGDPVAINRQYGRDSTDEDQELELSSEVSTEDSLVADLSSQLERFQLLQEPKKKPPGLTQEALDCLHTEVFSSRKTGLESRVQDCGICLESFTEGDELIHLPCGHKFHSGCLDPWIRTCGDCPYCRRCIVLNSELPQN